MNERLITVVVPSYKSPDLKTAIDSVLEQKYGAYELVLVDDGTPGFDREAVEGYIRAHKRENLRRVKVEENGTNQGTVKTMNRCLALAEGKYIVPLAGDDALADPGVLSAWAGAFDETDDEIITAVHGDYDGQLERRLGEGPGRRQRKMLRTLEPRALLEELGPENFVFGCSTAYTRAVLERLGGFDGHYRLIDDHPLMLKALREGVRIGFLERETVKHRDGGSSSEIRFDSRYEDEADSVFQNEVLPYTKHPARAGRRYRRWKKRQRLTQRYQAYQCRFRGRPAALLAVCVWYHAHYPLRAAGRLTEKLTIKQKER